MPQAAAGNNIADSTQINPGVIQGSDIAAGAIDTTKFGVDAVESADIKDGEIVNADINASAAIVDTKLAQITTAGKVSGAALTSLASIPAGAGVIPSANLPGGADLTAFPMPLIPCDGLSTTALGNNADGFLAMFTTVRAVTVNKISFNITAVGSAGPINIGVFSEDGQTRYINVTTGTISATGVNTVAVSAVVLPAGNYYFVFQVNGTTSVTFTRWAPVSAASNLRDVTSEPKLCGQYTLTASTMATTLTLASISSTADGGTIVVRLDN